MANGKKIQEETPLFENIYPTKENIYKHQDNLFKALVAEGYDMGTFLEFQDILKDEAKVNIMYDNLSPIYNLPGKEQFKLMLGVKKKEEGLEGGIFGDISKDRKEDFTSGREGDTQTQFPQTEQGSLVSFPETDIQRKLDNIADNSPGEMDNIPVVGEELDEKTEKEIFESFESDFTDLEKDYEQRHDSYKKDVERLGALLTELSGLTGVEAVSDPMLRELARKKRERYQKSKMSEAERETKTKTSLKLRQEVSSKKDLLDASNTFIRESTRMLELAQSPDKLTAFGKGTSGGIKGYFEDYANTLDALQGKETLKGLEDKVERYNKGEDVDFTEEETLFLKAAQKNIEAIEFTKDKIPLAGELGQIVGGSLAFLGEFALTAGVGKGLWAGKGAGKLILRKTVKPGLQTLAMPSFTKGAIKNIGVEEKKALQGTWDAFYETYTEVFTETLFMGKVAKIGKAAGGSAFRQTIDKGLQRIGSALAGRKGIGGFVKGFVEENVEEQIARLMQAVKSEKDVEGVIKQMTNVDEQLKTVYAVSIMSGAFGTVAAIPAGVSIISNSAAKYKLKKAEERIDKKVKEYVDVIWEDENVTLEDAMAGVHKIALDYASEDNVQDEKEATRRYEDVTRYSAWKLRDKVYKDQIEQQKEEEKTSTSITEKKTEAPKEDKEIDKKIEENQKRLGLNTIPDITISEETNETFNKLEQGEPTTYERIQKAEDNLYSEYLRLEKMKNIDSRAFTIAQINSKQKNIGETITILNEFKNKQVKEDKFLNFKEFTEKEKTPSYRVGTIEYANKEDFLDKVKQFQGQENTPDFQVFNDPETAKQVEEILKQETPIKETKEEVTTTTEKKAEVPKEEKKITQKEAPKKETPKKETSKKEVPTTKFTGEKGQRFISMGKIYEFTGEQRSNKDFVAEEVETKKEMGVAPTALETLKPVETIETAAKEKEVSSKKEQTPKTQPTKKVKAEALPEITTKEVQETATPEQAEKVKDTYNNLTRQLAEIPEGQDTRTIGKEYTKIQKHLPEDTKKAFIEELKKKEQTWKEKQKKLEEQGEATITPASDKSATFLDLEQQINSLEEGKSPQKLATQINKVKEELTKNEEVALKNSLKKKQKAYIEFKNTEKKEKAKEDIKTGLANLASAVTTKKTLLQEDIPKIHESLMQIARGSFDYSMTHVEELIRKIRDTIRQAIPDKRKQRQIEKELGKLRPQIEKEFGTFKEGIIPETELEETTEAVEEATEEMVKVAAKKTGADIIEARDWGILSTKEKSPKEARRAVGKAATDIVVERRKKIALAMLGLNHYISQLQKKHTTTQLEVISFLIEKKGVPEKLGRPDLVEAYEKYKNDPEIQKTIRSIKNHYDKMWEEVKNAIPDLSAEQIKDYITHIWNIPKGKLNEVTNWFSTSNRFLKKRYIESIREGIEKYGLTPRTLRADEILRIHGTVTINAVANQTFVNAIQKLHLDGQPLILPSTRVSDRTWREMTHPAFRRLVFLGKSQKETVSEEGKVIKETVKITGVPVKVDPQLYPYLNDVLGANLEIGKFWRRWDRTVSFVKKMELFVSFFHHLALLESALAKIGPVKTTKAIKETIKGLLKGEVPAFANMPLAEKAVGEYLVQIGKSHDVDFSGVQKDLNKLASKVDDLIDKLDSANLKTPRQILKAIQPFKLLAKTNEVWDRVLWDYLHDAFKIYAVEHMDENMPKRLKTEREIKEWKINQGQIINDIFGGQNPEMLMIASNHIINPKVWNVLKRILLSRDWFVSTTRQALGIMGFGDVYKTTLGETFSRKERMMEWWKIHQGRVKQSWEFWLKAGAYTTVIVNSLNVVFRKRDKEENPQFYINLVLDDGSKPKVFRDEDTGEYYYKYAKRNKQGELIEKKISIEKRGNNFYSEGKKLEIEDKLDNLVAYSMLGNTVGNRTLLFKGRDAQGYEIYLRWGKQFRELPEMLIDPIKKIGAKASPPLQLIAQLTYGHSLGGFENYELKNAQGLEWWLEAFKVSAKMFLPFSLSSLVRADKDFMPIDIAMPRRKGMTKGMAIDYFEKAIYRFYENGEGREDILSIFDDADKNNLPAYDLSKIATGNVLARQTSEIRYNFKTIEELDKEIDEESAKENPDNIYLNKLYQRKRFMILENSYFENSANLRDIVIPMLNAEETKFIKKENEKLKK
jgi:hypothetical protein